MSYYHHDHDRALVDATAACWAEVDREREKSIADTSDRPRGGRDLAQLRHFIRNAEYNSALTLLDEIEVREQGIEERIAKAIEQDRDDVRRANEDPELDRLFALAVSQRKGMVTLMHDLRGVAFAICPEQGVAHELVLAALDKVAAIAAKQERERPAGQGDAEP